MFFPSFLASPALALASLSFPLSFPFTASFGFAYTPTFAPFPLARRLFS